LTRPTMPQLFKRLQLTPTE